MTNQTDATSGYGEGMEPRTQLQFTVDLGSVELTAEEISEIQNKITKQVFDFVAKYNEGALEPQEPRGRRHCRKVRIEIDSEIK
jgi:hypothetical protein